MDIILKFKFAHSRSINFKEAIRLAKNFEKFSESSSGYQLEISKSELFKKWDYFAPFHHYVTRWAGTQVWFNDKLIAPYKNDKFYSFQEIYYCVKAYNNSYDKENYCYYDDKFRGWGCVRIKSIRKNIAFYSWNYWYKYGKFIENTKWEIDKEKILEIITNESIVNCSNICPYFNISKIINSVNQLPNVIDLTKDKGWEIVYAKNFVGSSFINVPIGIQHSDVEPEPVKPEFDEIDNEQDEINKLLKIPPDKLTNDQINKLLEYMKKQKNV